MGKSTPEAIILPWVVRFMQSGALGESYALKCCLSSTVIGQYLTTKALV